ncbi:hypothetical protein IW262DRAFT_1301911 [Armillaria fumosa]|nr:hypothetical protein IW262DRAFT_1301911 [Armillaria fumosa]
MVTHQAQSISQPRSSPRVSLPLCLGGFKDKDYLSSPIHHNRTIHRISSLPHNDLASDEEDELPLNEDSEFESSHQQHQTPIQQIESSDKANLPDSGAPPAGNKCLHSLPQSDDSPNKKPCIAKVVAGTKGLNQCDYEGKAQQILHKVCKECEWHVYTLNGYPEVKDFQLGISAECVWTQEQWSEVCEEVGEDYELMQAMQTMTDMWSLVAVMYGFVESNKRASIACNKKNHLMLAAHGAFTCKDPKTLHHHFENKIIPMVITEHFFGHRKASGIIWEKDFEVIKPETLALVVTILEHCIDEWSNDTYQSLKLNEDIQAACYNSHLKDINNWCSGNTTVTANIHHLWATKGCTHVNVWPKQTTDGFIDDTEKERLAAELQGRTGEMDSEAENDDNDEENRGSDQLE